LSGARTALVTGGATGIGAAIVAALRADGLRVILFDTEAIDDPEAQQVDVSDADAVAAAVARCPERIDVLVNNAGILRPGALRTLDLDDLDRQIAVNLRGPFVVSQAVLPRMPDGSCLVNVVSELAYLGRQQASAYAATKGALLTATRSWARELAPSIRVNAVAPGPVDTALLDLAGMDDQERALETANPMGRIGRPEEIAAVVAFLASSAASFVTGQCYGADGGAAMR